MWSLWISYQPHDAERPIIKTPHTASLPLIRLLPG